jgi:hypothetical protein
MEKVTAIHSAGGVRFSVRPETFKLVHRDKSNVANAGWFYRFQTEDGQWMLFDLSQALAFELASQPNGRPWN